MREIIGGEMRFYEPSAECLSRLSRPFCCSYSGGKDSTSLVTWIEWLRRTGQIKVDRPQLVQSDTTVEYPALQALSRDMMDLLRTCGWECAVVEPLINEKLYNRILGIGNSPIHPGITRMRWCTRSTKIDPMERWRDANTGVNATTFLTGLRIGENAMRDGKIKKRGCAAGGECGLPDLDERTWSPILNWTTCNVIGWLTAEDVGRDTRKLMKDVFALTWKLVAIYDVEIDRNVFDFADPYVKSARFGCIGCPAIQAEREPPKSSIARHGRESPLNELYDVWFEARQRVNRCVNKRKENGNGRGPIRLEVRKHLFERVMDIQRRAGVTLITPEDEAFIRDCWERRVYPRGWSEADELVVAPPDTTLLTVNGEPI
jgi:DNA sulfur modification protein DndC